MRQQPVTRGTAAGVRMDGRYGAMKKVGGYRKVVSNQFELLLASLKLTKLQPILCFVMLAGCGSHIEFEANHLSVATLNGY